MNISRILKAVLLSLVMAVLVSCGGSDGGSSSNTKSTTAPAPAPAPPPTPAPSPDPAPAPAPDPAPAPAPAPPPPPATTCPPTVHPHENFLAIGDSITAGTGDRNASDNVTADGCYEGKGYPPVLIDKLTAAKGRSHIVINKGVGGTRSGDGVKNVANLLGGDSMHVLILYGTNDSRVDAGSFIPVKQFKANMQNIINKVRAAGKNAFLAKIPPVLAESNHHPKYSSLGIAIDQGSRNKIIQQYNIAIDELVRENGISIRPPDFYTYFKTRPNLFYDNLHPNGVGYQIMAEMWFQRLRSL